MLSLLHAVFVAPLLDMAGSPTFLAEVLIGGIAAGLMYSLVALGFVLIFKASGVFNFAQGVMVLFAALTLVGLLERGVPVPVALGLTTLVDGVLTITGRKKDLIITSGFNVRFSGSGTYQLYDQWLKRRALYGQLLAQ